MSNPGGMAPSDAGRPPPAELRAVPVGVTDAVPCLPSAHPGRRLGGAPSVIDERARRLSHEELAVAGQLAAEGHQVRSLPERRGHGPQADLEVCGARVEVKSFLSLPDREGRLPTARSVCNKLLDARGQAPTAVLDGRTSGLSESVARDGVAEFVDRGRPGKVTGVRVIGDGFDLSWSIDRSRIAGRTDPGRYQHPSVNRGDRSQGVDRAMGG